MRILLIDGHTLFREGLRPILEQLSEVSRILEAGSFAEGLKLAKQRPDLVLLEIKAPGCEGASVVKFFRQHFPHVRLVVVSSVEDHRVIKETLDYGADGYVCKCSSGSTLLNALSLVMAGSLYVPHQLLHPMATVENERNSSNRRSTQTKTHGLTSRQMDVLRCLADGLSNKEIGEAIHLAEGTVKVHVAALFQTLGVRKRLEAVQAAKQRGVALMTGA